MASELRHAARSLRRAPGFLGASALIPADGSPTLNLRLVVVDRGREVRTIVVGNATGSIGIRVD